jgi:hypothetical protein
MKLIASKTVHNNSSERRGSSIQVWMPYLLLQTCRPLEVRNWLTIRRGTSRCSVWPSSGVICRSVLYKLIDVLEDRNISIFSEGISHITCSSKCKNSDFKRKNLG